MIGQMMLCTYYMLRELQIFKIITIYVIFYRI
jgi:hypothetical protein